MTKEEAIEKISGLFVDKGTMAVDPDGIWFRSEGKQYLLTIEQCVEGLSYPPY